MLVTPNVPPSAGQRVFKSSEVMVSISNFIDDRPSLLNLLRVCEAEGHVLEHWPLSLLISALLNSMPLECRQMAVAIVALHGVSIRDSNARADFVNTYLGHTDEPLPNNSNLLTAFVELRTTSHAIEAFIPLYIQACMAKLNHIEAVRAHRPGNRSKKFGICSGGVRIMPRPYRYHWRWASDYKIAEKEEYPDLNPHWEERSRFKKLEATPYRWRLPAQASEVYRIERAFWSIHLFCKVFAERPTMDNGEDKILSLDRKMYLARLQDWEYEEMASVLPFLSAILETIYRPAVYHNPKEHNEKSLASLEKWKAQYGPDPQSEHYDLDLQANVYLSTHYDRLTKRIAEDKSNAQIRWYGDVPQQKWIAHEVSRGLPHIYRSYIQILKDSGNIIRRNYPQHRYEPGLFFKAPSEAIMNEGPLGAPIFQSVGRKPRKYTPPRMA